jgi:hypothetical protein
MTNVGLLPEKGRRRDEGMGGDERGWEGDGCTNDL